LHNIGQKFLADKGGNGKVDYWKYHAAATPLKQKFEMYLKEYKHRVGILKGTPRAAADQQQEVVGLVRNYDAGASFTNQDAEPVNMSLAFTEEHVKDYEGISAQLATSVAKTALTGEKLVRQFVKLCACELKFLLGCSVQWDKLPVAGEQSASADQESDPASVAASSSPSPKLTQPPSPKQKLTQPPSALSSGAEEDDTGESDEDSDAAYATGDDRGGDRIFQFTMIDPENIYECDWTDFKYPVAKHFASRFREAHALAALFHLNAELAAKFPVLSGQINTGWIAHYNKPIHVDQILQPPTVGEMGWEAEEVEWLEQTVRYYVEEMTPQQREELGITPEQARRIRKKATDQVRRELPAARLTLS
jgi:hypothetical protein